MNKLSKISHLNSHKISKIKPYILKEIKSNKLSIFFFNMKDNYQVLSLLSESIPSIKYIQVILPSPRKKSRSLVKIDSLRQFSTSNQGISIPSSTQATFPMIRTTTNVPKMMTSKIPISSPL